MFAEQKWVEKRKRIKMGITRELLEHNRVIISLIDPNIQIKGTLKFLDLDTGRLTLDNYLMINEKGKVISRGDAILLQNNIWTMIRKGDKIIIPNNYRSKQ